MIALISSDKLDGKFTDKSLIYPGFPAVILQATAKVRCPNCGKNLMVNVDITSPEESWIEECKYCNQSLHVASKHDNGSFAVIADKL